MDVASSNNVAMGKSQLQLPPWLRLGLGFRFRVRFFVSSISGAAAAAENGVRIAHVAIAIQIGS